MPAIETPIQKTLAEAPATRTRRQLPPVAAFTGASLAFFGMYIAAGAPTPLFVLFQEQWAFPAWVLTIAFATYAVGLLLALLVAGSLSDHIGRRPVLIGALVVELIAMVIFIFAPSIGWIIAARAIQGIATGAATSTFSASIVELAPARYKRLGTLFGGLAPAGGLALGVLATGVAVQFTVVPAVIVFTALAVIMILGTLVAVFSAETVARRPGAARSLIPRISIPLAAQREFAASIPVYLGAWMLAGLYLALAPSIIRGFFHIDSGLLNGTVAGLEPAAAAIAGLLIGGLTARRTTLIGGVTIFAGIVLTVAGITTASLPLLFAGSLVGGVGFGSSFSGALRTIAPLAGTHQRAELFAAVYLVAYLAFGVPVIIAGQLITPLGLLTTVVVYGAVIALVAIVGIIAQLRVARIP